MNWFCLLHLAASLRRDPLRLRHDLKSSMADGVAYSVMVGVGETYVPAFVLALGMGSVAAGLVVTLPVLLGAIFQLISPWGVARLGSHRRWVVACATVQALSLLLLLGIALGLSEGPVAIFLAATLYWTASLATGPAWNTWMEEIVPKRLRARFFAARAGICQAAVLAGFVGGGIVLQASSGTRHLFTAFALLFGVAAICRAASAVFLARHSESVRFCNQQSSGLRQMLGSGEGGPGLMLLAYLFAVQAAVYIAAPFFTPYMLKELNFSYAQYMVLTSLAVAAKTVALPRIGVLAQRLGGQRLLWLGGISIAPLSALWVVSGSFAYLAVVQVLSGLAWALYELAMFLMFFEAIPRHRRTSVLTLYNLGNSLAMVGGSLVGALLLRLADLGWTTYLTLFLISSMGRLASIGILCRIQPAHAISATPATRTLAVRPSAGTLEQPILPSLPNGLEHAPSQAAALDAPAAGQAASEQVLSSTR